MGKIKTFYGFMLLKCNLTKIFQLNPIFTIRVTLKRLIDD